MYTDLRVYLGLSEFGEKMNSRFSCSGLMVSKLDSVLEGLGSRPGSVIVLCSWAKHFTCTVSLKYQEYK